MKAGLSAVALVFIARLATAGLTEGPRLAAIYDSILDARFDLAAEQVKAACPPAPDAACRGLEAMSLWWQIQIVPENRGLDSRLEEASARAIAAADAWTMREPRRGEAWLYLAGAYTPRVQLHALRGNGLSAARDGNRIRIALERALELDPSLTDAHFGIGLYHYYAAVAPAALKMLRFLLMLPGGDRQKGLKEILEVRSRGELLRGEADYQLHLLYLWYEHKTADAMEILSDLDRRYPHNPLFKERLATVADDYLHDAAQSAASWRDLLDRALAGTVYEPQRTEIRARLGLAAKLIALGERDRAIEQATIVVNLGRAAPDAARARANELLRLARAR